MKHKQRNENQERQRQVRRDAFMKLGLIFLGILILADTIQLSRFGEIVERVDQYNRGVVDELGGFRQDIITFGDDMNEMRSFLLLPTKEYSFMEEQEEIATEEEKDATPTEQAVYQFLGSYVDEKTAAENARYADEHILALASDEQLVKATADLKLTIGKIESTEEMAQFKISNETGLALFAVVIEKQSAKTSIQSSLGTKDFEKNPDDAQQIAEYITKNAAESEKMKLLLEERKAMILSAAQSAEATALEKEKKLIFSDEPEEAEDVLRYYYTNEEESPVVTLSLSRKDGTIMIGEKAFTTPDDLKNGLVEALKNADAATEMEKMIRDRREELQKIFEEEAFKDLLLTNNLTIAPEPREEYNKLLFDVTNADGKTEFSFVIELSSGLLKILKNNEEIDLYSLLQGSKKKP